MKLAYSLVYLGLASAIVSISYCFYKILGKTYNICEKNERLELYKVLCERYDIGLAEITDLDLVDQFECKCGSCYPIN